MDKVKFLLALTLAMGAAFGAKSQTIGTVPISEINAPYIEIVGQAKLLKIFEVTIYADYGQIGSMKEIRDGHILDDNGKRMAFNGMMGAVNFFAAYGYELDLAYPLSTGNGLVYHYILKKRELE